MLSGFRIANFKAFGASQHVPLRPLTLLFGANSAGKSSVLHALALAHHAVETGELDAHRTRIGGEAIDLGGFGQYVHRRRIDSHVELTFELPLGPVSDLREAPQLALVHGARAVSLQLNIGRASDSAGTAAEVERYAIECDGRPLLSMHARADGLLHLDLLDHSLPVFRRNFEHLLTLFTTASGLTDQDYAVIAGAMDEMVPDLSARQPGLFPRLEGDAGRSRLGEQVQFVMISRGRRQEDLVRASTHYLPTLLRSLTNELARVGGAELRRLVYLGPLRSYPPRHLVVSQQHDSNWFAGGGHAWDVVRTDDNVRHRVNRWLGDAERLKTPYELRVRRLLPPSAVSAELSPQAARALGRLAFNILAAQQNSDFPENLRAAASAVRRHGLEGGPGGDPLPVEVAELVDSLEDTGELAEEWVREMTSRADSLPDLVLIDKRSGTELSHRDVGIGISQVLPVLVSAYASRNKFVAIEQPEIHLHPGLQAELGDVFLESALCGSGNRFLIETHSEHLILRILRRIRETSDGELPEGACPVKPEDVAVLHVRPGSKGAEVVHIPIAPDGDFEQRWPDGFFAERARELF